MNYSIEEIKNTHNVLTYARDHGLNVLHQGDRTPSFIEPGNNKTCVIYYKDWWFDHKTRQGGDVIDLCAILEHGGDRGAAIRELGGNQIQWVPETQKLNNKIELWHQNLKHRDYLHDRGITDKTINELKIGEFRNRIIIPYWKNGYFCNWIGRTLKEVTKDNPKYFKTKKEGIVQSIPWGLNTLGRSDTLIITEGAFDALSFYQEGYSVLATMGGWFSKEQLKTVRSAVLSHKNTLLVFDSDKPGQEFTHSLAKHLFKHKITRFSIINIPSKYKDVSEIYEEKGNLNELFNQKQIDGLRYLASGLDRTELKQYLFKAARFVPIEDINLLIDNLKSEHEGSWLKEIKKQIGKAPPQSMIANEVIKDHQLLFSEKTDFYEYKGNKWNQKTDNEIRGYIDKTLGNFTSNALINSVLGLVKARTNNNIEFNKKHLMNFKNGTLELDTGNFRPAKADDYLTFETDYNYDPNANCDLFQDFLIDITDNQPDKIILLQEIMGYVLFPENTLQKCAFFIGEGGNGKSVLTDIFKYLFGENSVSTVDVSSLNSEFQRILLKDSMVNIAPDIKADMKGAEDYFKRVVAGDPINGCFKGKDFIQFIPHAKFIISANSFIKPNDISYGMERRMLFVNFPIKFVDDPKLPNEKKLNNNITKQLIKELPGIFNWAYIGYKRLMENQRFSETEEHKKLIEEFRSEINPVYDFCKEFLKDKTQFTTQEAWNEFMTTYNSRLSQRAFSMSLAKEIKKNFPLWEKFSNGKVRGYRLKRQL